MTKDDEEKATKLLDEFECLLDSAMLASDMPLFFLLCNRTAEIMMGVQGKWTAMAEKRKAFAGAVLHG